MDARYLLDTNIASYIIKGSSAPLDRRVRKTPIAALAISAVTEGELRYGAARLPSNARIHAMLEEFLLHVDVLPWDSDCAARYGLLRAALERDGQPMGNLDTMIGAHALALGMILVTNDHAFSRIRALKVEDWTKGPRA